MSNTTLATSFLSSFMRTRKQREEKEEADQERKARLKLFELQLRREELAQADAEKQGGARQSFFDEASKRLLPSSGFVSSPGQTGVQIGDVGATMAAPASLTELLADPQMALRALQAGIPLPQQQQEPETIRTLRALSGDPDLMKAEIARRSAGATNINLGAQGLSQPPSGFARPDPLKPGLVRETGGPPTSGQQSLDQAFGTDAAAWVAAGGFADTQKSIAQLGEAKAALDAVASGQSKEQLTGPLVAKIPEFAKPLFNPRAIAVRESVEEIVQRNLRLVLGAQFTEKEGERLIARAYNENLQEAENAKRVGRLIKQLGSAALAKQEAVDYFNEHGTLEGFTGKIWTLADFDPEVSGAPGGGAVRGQELPQGIPPGSVVVGTDADSGRPVYRAPDGRMLIVD